MDAKTYYDGLLKTAGVEDTARQALLTGLFADEKAAKVFTDDANARMRQDDYSRKLDELTSMKKRNEDWYAKELITKSQLDAAKADYEQKLAALGQNNNGDNNGDNGDKRLNTSVGDMVTKKELDELLGKRDGNVISIVKGAMKYATDHLHRFGEPLDPDALEKIAVDGNLPLNLAYEKLIAPKLATKQEADFKKQLEDAKAEGARDFASTHHIPVESQPKEPHMIFDRKAPEANAPKPGTPEFERTLRNTFVDEWNKVPASATT